MLSSGSCLKGETSVREHKACEQNLLFQCSVDLNQKIHLDVFW